MHRLTRRLSNGQAVLRDTSIDTQMVAIRKLADMEDAEEQKNQKPRKQTKTEAEPENEQ